MRDKSWDKSKSFFDWQHKFHQDKLNEGLKSMSSPPDPQYDPENVYPEDKDEE